MQTEITIDQNKASEFSEGLEAMGILADVTYLYDKAVFEIDACDECEALEFLRAMGENYRE